MLPPAGLVGVDHRTGPHPLEDLPDLRLAPLGDAARHPDDRPCAQVEAVDRLEVPLDRADRQSPRLPQRGDQAHQPDPQPLLPDDHVLQLGRRRRPPPPTLPAAARHEHVRDHLGRARLDLEDLPRPLDRTPGQQVSAPRAAL
jgi:hypothetical protein